MGIQASGFLGRARAYALKREYEKVIADCTEAIRLDSKYAEAYLLRGDAYSVTGEKERGEADYAEARKLGAKP